MKSVDPRLSVISSRLSGIGSIVAVTGGKGGVGKSVTSALLALDQASRGRRAGLLDLDLCSPSQHLVLGAEGLFPEEKNGIVPPLAGAVRLLSLAFFLRSAPAPLRGVDITNVIVELLAITQWGELDTLVVDMPPGLGDAALDVLRLMPRARSLLVTIPSKVALGAAERCWALLRDQASPVLGLIENMRGEESSSLVEEACGRMGLPFLGAVPRDSGLEAALGDPQRLLETRCREALAEIARDAGLF